MGLIKILIMKICMNKAIEPTFFIKLELSYPAVSQPWLYGGVSVKLKIFGKYV
jgi:hypothetical protein